ncbi:MAG: archaetidylserine decarboxylase [Kofleriaceae bacterium]|nr:archaetidylserine decarboxylase [Kofleriaceae bacterium]
MDESKGTAATKTRPRTRSTAGAAYSALVGTFASQTLPTPLRGIAYRTFARAVGADLSEVELALADYPSLGDFFARKLRDGARRVDAGPNVVISPCDGRIAAVGTAVDGALVQAKGRMYSLAELVVDGALATRLRGGAYATIYLSPRDYHRVHAPIDARLVRYEYIPGTLWPVNAWATARREGLLARNERVVIHMTSEAVGDFAFVMVGAAGVGNIRLAHAPDSSTFRGARERRTIELPANTLVRRGDELGAFRLGSTVVMVFPPGKVRLEGDIGQAVLFGAALGALAGGDA